MLVIPSEAAAVRRLFSDFCLPRRSLGEGGTSDLCHSAADHAYGAEFGLFLNVHKIRVDSDNKR